MGTVRRRSASEAGFTLMEILIAMVVLMIGLVGIMSVFPEAMRRVNRTIEMSYAAAISRSVLDAIELGIREMRTAHPDWQGFILEHDGPEDLETDRNGFLRDLNLSAMFTPDGGLAPEMTQLMRKGYFVLLPRPPATGPGGAPTGGATEVFCYPRVDPTDNEGRKIYDGTVRKVFQLGKKLRESAAEDAVVRELEQTDPFSQYGYAFTLRPARAPTPEAPGPDRSLQRVVPGLFEVVVKVYRNYSDVEGSRTNDPIAEFTSYVTAQ